MLKRSILTLLIICSISAASMAAPVGLLFTVVSEPVAATSLTESSKVGDASSFGFLGLIAFGDAGIQAASKKAKITAIHHVDKSCLYLLGGLFMMETTKVYGQ